MADSGVHSAGQRWAAILSAASWNCGMIGSPLHMRSYHSAGPLREACALPFEDLFAKLAGFMEYRPLSIYWLRPRDLPKDRHPAEVMPVPRSYYFNEECGAWAAPFLGEEYTDDLVGAATRWHDSAFRDKFA